MNVGKSRIQDAIAQAKKKGLTVRKNSFKNGWSVTMPNGAGFHAVSDNELVMYVRAY